ncbi:hypothetical protein [Pararhodobacter zhoushanensis]|uniref:hypothetical protein n=1 Tax=Pararhodobacter zhoushanensis TaxID=2479545 RepID=UPI000F8D316E|nr:hypothetical protein [Pararhodobacter zhoushanensis]
MKSKPFRAFALSSALALLALPGLAQVTLTPLSVTARSYESASNWQERPYRPAGLVETVRIPGHVLVDVRAVFDGPWSDSIERVQANTRDILLVLPDGTELEAQGSYATWGQLSLQSRTMSARRPRNFPDEDQDVYWNGMFRVPKGVNTATLRIGGDDVRFEGQVSIPGPVMEEDAAAFASFRPTAVRRFRTVALEDGRGDEMMSSTITAPAGMVLAEVEIEVTGVTSNQVDDGERFTWNTHNFRLVDASGATMGMIGERFMRRILDSQFNGTDIGDSAERTVIWVVPEGLTEARLLFGETEVARVALGSAAITETD